MSPDQISLLRNLLYFSMQHVLTQHLVTCAVCVMQNINIKCLCEVGAAAAPRRCRCRGGREYAGVYVAFVSPRNVDTSVEDSEFAFKL